MANKLSSNISNFKDNVQKAVDAYFLKHSKSALKPNTAPVVGRKYVYLYNEGKKLCRYHIATGVVDQETKLVKNYQKLIDENKELFKRYGSMPFPFPKDFGEHYKYVRLRDTTWFRIDPSGKEKTIQVTVTFNSLYYKLRYSLMQAGVLKSWE